jgi:hypothetical protein
MTKLSLTLASLALLAAPAMAGNDYGQNACKASDYDCKRLYGEYTDKAGFKAMLGRDQERGQSDDARVENNDGNSEVRR